MNSQLAIDQSLQSSGWAASSFGEIYQCGVIKTKGLTDLDAMRYQRDAICERIIMHHPDTIILEDVHYRRNHRTTIKLAGMLILLRDMCVTMGYQHVVVTSQEVQRHLKLPIGRTSKERKHMRAEAYAGEIVWGDINRAVVPIQDDIASAIILLDQFWFSQNKKHLVCIDPVRALGL